MYGRGSGTGQVKQTDPAPLQITEKEGTMTTPAQFKKFVRNAKAAQSPLMHLSQQIRAVEIQNPGTIEDIKIELFRIREASTKLNDALWLGQTILLSDVPTLKRRQRLQSEKGPK